MTPKREPQNNPTWTAERDALLTSGFRAGDTPADLAAALNCTPGSVRLRLNNLGLARGACAPPDVPRPQQDDDAKRTRQSDLAFQRAMLAAIGSGAEKVQAGVAPTRAPTHWVRPLYGESIIGYRSSAGLAAELGEG